MAHSRTPRSLNDAGRRFLTAELRALAHSSALARRRGGGDRIALTFRPARQGRDGLPGGPIPLDDFRLLALSGRPGPSGDGWGRRRLVLAIYRPVLDPDGSGRVGYRCEQAFDVASPRSLYRPTLNATAARAAVVLHQALADADPGDFATTPAWPRFYRGFDPGREPEPDATVTPDAWAAAEVAVGGLRAWPAEMLADRPAGPGTSRVFASLAHLKGRRVRNPAFAVLRRHGLLTARLGDRAWLDTLGLPAPGGLVDGTSRAGRLRRSIEAYATADPANERALPRDARDGCAAIGVRIGTGPDGDDTLAGLLDSPWWRPEVHYAGGLRLIRLAGPAGPTTMTFADATCAVNFFDLGGDPSSHGPMRCEDACQPGRPAARDGLLA